MNRQEIVEKYLGVPYLNMGRDLKGLDCYGLLMSVYKDFGFDLVDLEINYEEGWALKGANHFAENYSLQWECVDKPKFLDVILFKNSKGIYNHAGIYLGKGDFIHTCRLGTVVSNYFSMTYKDRVVGFYRFKGRQ